MHHKKWDYQNLIGNFCIIFIVRNIRKFQSFSPHQANVFPRVEKQSLQLQLSLYITAVYETHSYIMIL